MADYFSTDTIVAVIAPPGGALSAIRISGTDAHAIIRALTKKEPPKNTHELVRRTIYFGDRAIDDATVVCFHGEKSFTGEDSAEIFLHGSPWVTEQTIESCIQQGARQALAGEFSFRAVRNGKMDLVQAQAVADLITAKNESAATLALEKLSGQLSKELQSLAEGLRTLTVQSELGIDFSDQDIAELELTKLKKHIIPIERALKELFDGFDRGRRIQDGIRLALIGSPNAGKSSFFNALLGENRAIVSDQAGTTRDTLREVISLRSESGVSVQVRLSDTAGIRSSQDAIEQDGVQRSKNELAQADLVVAVANPTQEGWAQKLDEISAATSGARMVLVLTHADRLSGEQSIQITQESAAWVAAGRFAAVHLVSSVTGQGVSASARGLAAVALSLLERKPGEILITSIEQREAVGQALACLKRASEAQAHDLFAADLKQALLVLSDVIGATPPDAILNRIFSQFCIGK